MEKISYHNFIFPFLWSIKGKDEETLTQKTELNNIDFAENTNWLHSPTLINADTKDKHDNNVLYDEKNYFHTFIHNALYDNGETNSLLRHYEREEPQLAKEGGQKNVRYCIETDKKTYSLIVDAINLNLYSTGVGMLSFYLYNEEYADPMDILIRKPQF